MRSVEQKGRREVVRGEGEWAQGNSRLSFVTCKHMLIRHVERGSFPTTCNLGVM